MSRARKWLCSWCWSTHICDPRCAHMLVYCWPHNKGERGGFVRLNNFDGMNCMEKRIDEAWLLFAIMFFVLAAMWGRQNSQKRMDFVAAKGSWWTGEGCRETLSKKGWKIFQIWICLSLADGPRLSLWLYYRSRDSAVPISCTFNVFGAICPGFGPELMCTDSG